MPTKKQVWLGFRVLCLVSGSGWVLDEWQPDELHGLARTGAHLGVLSLVFWGLGVARKEVQRTGAAWGKVAMWGAALLALPQVVIAGAGGRLSSLTEVLVFGLVPAVVVFTMAQRAAGFGLGESPMRTLRPSLVGLGGLALLVPFAWPATGLGMGWLVGLGCAAALSGLAAVRLHDLLAGVGVLRAGAVACGAAALVASGMCWVGWSGLGEWSAGMVAVDAARCLLVDGPVLWLTMWLLREMTPVRFSSRYLLVPLVTVVEGFALVRPQRSWTMGLGFLLLAGGCAGLLRADSEEAQAEL